MPPLSKRFHWEDSLEIAGACLVAGVVIGVAEKLMCQWVCPPYFSMLTYADALMHAPGQVSLGRQWIPFANRINPGLFFGSFTGLFFTAYAFLISKGTCRFSDVWRMVLEMAAVTIACAFLLGFDAWLALWLFPDLLDSILTTGAGRADQLRFAWVTGSILGIYGGSCLGLLLTCRRFTCQWQKLPIAETPLSQL